MAASASATGVARLLIYLLLIFTLPVKLNAAVVPEMTMVVPTKLLVLTAPALTLPEVLICPDPANMLPPVTLPEALTLVPVMTPPTTDAAVVVPVTLVLDPVITPPTVLAAVCVPVTELLVPVMTPPTVLAAV